MIPTDFQAYLVDKNPRGQVHGKVARVPSDRLGPGEVLVRVVWSSLNYKDALAATGHPGVVRNFPHIPGIDAAGEVVESAVKQLCAGQPVLVTSYELGAGQWGAWGEYIRVPAEWVLPLPDGLSARDAMAYGTAGLTAALSVAVLEHQGIRPDSGEVVVTGATGGVGSLAVMLLAKLGYRVVAVTGKPQSTERLAAWGAARVVGRDEVNDDSKKPLLAARWAGAVDTVGGNTLATIVRSLAVGGVAAACGLVGGIELPLSVYPFILRGATLAGIDSAWCPRQKRLAMWQHLAGPWKLAGLDDLVTEVPLNDIAQYVTKILAGEIVGRVIVKVAE